MGVPGWVRTLDDYWSWLEDLINASGALLDDEILSVQPLLNTHSVPVALYVDRHRLRFWDGSYLDLRLAVNADLGQIGYRFHYARQDDALVWRLDRHTGHEVADGADTHIHLGPDERRRPYAEVDLAEVLHLIHGDQLARESAEK